MSSSSNGQLLSVACLRDVEREHDDVCRSRSCHSRLEVRDVMTARGTITLCRTCRKQYFRVSS